MSDVFEKKFAESFVSPSESEASPFSQTIDEIAQRAAATEQARDSDFHNEQVTKGDEEGRSFSSESLAPRLSRLSSFLPPEMIHGRPLKWMILSFVAGVAIGASVLFFVMSALPPKTIVEEKIIEKTEIVYRDAPLAAGDNGNDNVDVVAISTGDPLKKRRGGKGRKKVETQTEKKQRLLAALSGSSSAKGSNGSSGGGLSQQQMSQTVNKHRSSLQLCYERDLKKGTAPLGRDLKVVFSVKVGSSGMVTEVVMRGSGAQIPTLKKCLRGAVSRWMFPSSGASSAVQFPIVFTPSR